MALVGHPRVQRGCRELETADMSGRLLRPKAILSADVGDAGFDPSAPCPADRRRAWRTPESFPGRADGVASSI